jgi:ABC-type phosphate transport system substrate-binding protein
LTSINNAATAGAPLLQTNITSSILNLPGANVYPISSFTYLLVYQNMTSLGYNKAVDIASFIWWGLNTGQQYANALYYPTLPSSVVTLGENILETLTYNNTAVPIVK